MEGREREGIGNTGVNQGSSVALIWERKKKNEKVLTKERVKAYSATTQLTFLPL